jgi:hypothetical protein
MPDGLSLVLCRKNAREVRRNRLRMWDDDRQHNRPEEHQMTPPEMRQ